MTYRFKKHYSPAEARALLPSIRKWLERILALRGELKKCEQRLEGLIEPGRDLGGSLVNTWVKTLADLQDCLMEFHRREIQINDIDRGLIDFPAIIGGQEVFICWEQEDEDIEFWHDLDAGYQGRQRL